MTSEYDVIVLGGGSTYDIDGGQQHLLELAAFYPKIAVAYTQMTSASGSPAIKPSK
jgi:hypothetical protein